MSKFLRPNKASLKNGQHFSFMQAFVTVLEQQGFTASKITALKTQLLAASNKVAPPTMVATKAVLVALAAVPTWTTTAIDSLSTPRN